jgi:hypothetical protein
VFATELPRPLDVGVGRRGGSVRAHRRGMDLVSDDCVVVVLVAVDIPESSLEERAEEGGQAINSQQLLKREPEGLRNGPAASRRGDKMLGRPPRSYMRSISTYKARKAKAASVFLIVLWRV